MPLASPNRFEQNFWYWIKLNIRVLSVEVGIDLFRTNNVATNRPLTGGWTGRRICSAESPGSCECYYLEWLPSGSTQLSTSLARQSSTRPRQISARNACNLFLVARFMDRSCLVLQESDATVAGTHLSRGQMEVKQATAPTALKTRDIMRRFSPGVTRLEMKS